LAFLGIAVYIAIDLLFAGLSGLAFFIAAYGNGNHLQLDSAAWKIWFAAPVLVSSLLIGRMLPRWAPGHELAACLTFAILVSVYNLVPMLGDNGGAATLFCILIVSAAAMWGRRGGLAAPQPL
jgi:hypothetical protein